MNSKGFLHSALTTLKLVLLACLPLASLHGQVIYSLNSVGYADADCRAGSNLLASPFFNVDNTVSNLFRGLPDGSFFLHLAHGSNTFGLSNYYSSTTGWTAPGATFLAPDAGFLWLPSARRISFVGTVWSGISGPGCLTYSGEMFSGWFPLRSCALCEDPDNCPPDFSDGDLVFGWDRVNQRYWDPYWYGTGFGWVPSDPVFGPTEGLLIYSSRPGGPFPWPPLTGRSPFAGFPFGGPATDPIPTGMPRANLLNPQRTGTNLTFQWSSASNTHYAVFCSTNLNSDPWRLLQEGVAMSTGGLASITVPGTAPRAFYRAMPESGPWAVLFAGARIGTTFGFQLYAPVGTNYVVQRKTSLNAPSWQTITNIAAGPQTIVNVLDPNATAASGYYRVYY